MHDNRAALPSLSSLLLLPLLPLSGCSGEAPALDVDGARFSSEVVASLSSDQVDLLAAIAALGSGAATGNWQELGIPRLAAEERARMADRLRDELILEGAGVTESLLEEEYAAAPQFELEVRHLVVLSERWQPATARQAARGRAESGLERIRGGEPFETVAAELSEEPGAASRGGLLRPGREGTWVEEFWQAASRLVEGGVSPVVETPYGFHVLRLEARRTLPFSEARPSVVRAVARTLGGGEAWEESRVRWVGEVEILDPGGGLADVGDPSNSASHRARRSVVTFAAEGGDVLRGPDALVARWPGGGLSAEDVRQHLLSLPASRLRRVLDPDATDDRVAEVRRAAESHLLADRARERGLEPTASDRDTQLREWESQAVEWVGLLGLDPGADAEERRDQALAALRATGQNAGVARSAVAEAAPTLLSGVSISGTAFAQGGP